MRLGVDVFLAGINYQPDEQHLQTMVVYLPDGAQGSGAAAHSEAHLAAVLFPTVTECVCVCLCVCAHALQAVGWQAGGSFSVAL